MRCNDLLNSGMTTPHSCSVPFSGTGRALAVENSFPEVNRLGETHHRYQVFLCHGSIRPADEMSMVGSDLLHAGCCNIFV